MTGIGFIIVPGAVLEDAALCDKQRLLLGMVMGFGANGLWLSNGKLGNLLHIHPNYVSRLIADLEARGYVEIKNRQSRYRIIYLHQNVKVGDRALIQKGESKNGLLKPSVLSTLTFCADTYKEEKKEKKTPASTGSKGKKPKAKPTQDDLRFDAEFWPAYPKKRKKKDARKAFAKVNPSDKLLAVMMSALKKQTASDDWQKQDGKYIPDPTTWLNGERWEDDVEVPDSDVTSETAALLKIMPIRPPTPEELTLCSS